MLCQAQLDTTYHWQGLQSNPKGPLDEAAKAKLSKTMQGNSEKTAQDDGSKAEQKE